MDAHPGFVYREVAAQPSTEHANHVRVGVREGEVALGLAAFAGIESCAGGEEGLVAQGAEAFDAEGVHGLDLGGLAALESVRLAAAGEPPAGPRLEVHVAHPDGDGRLGPAKI